MLTKNPIEPNAIYTREETAQLLGISLSTLKTLIRTGQLMVSQPNGMRRMFIRGTSVLEMLTLTERNGVVSKTGNEKATSVNHPKWEAQISAETFGSRPKRKQAIGAHGSFDKRQKPVRATQGVRRGN